MSKHIQITKRDGTKEDLELEKLHKVVFHACEGITGVSASEVEIKGQIQFTAALLQLIFKRHLSKVRQI